MRTADSHETDRVVQAPAPSGGTLNDVDVQAALHTLRATPDVAESDMLDTLHKLIEHLTKHYVAGRLGDLTPQAWHVDMPADLRLAAKVYEKYGGLLIRAKAQDGLAHGASG